MKIPSRGKMVSNRMIRFQPTTTTMAFHGHGHGRHHHHRDSLRRRKFLFLAASTTMVVAMIVVLLARSRSVEDELFTMFTISYDEDITVSSSIVLTTSDTQRHIPANTTTTPTTASNDVSETEKHDAPPPRLHIVISHCDEPLDWIWGTAATGGYLHEHNWTTMTILSKCGRPPSPPPIVTKGINHVPPMTYIVELPNVGRCDHSYAYFIQQLLLSPHERELASMREWKLKKGSTVTTDDEHPHRYQSELELEKQSDTITIKPNDYVLFTKGNNNSHRKRRMKLSLDQMMIEVQRDGFSCGMTTRGTKQTMFVDGRTLSKFSIRQYERLDRDRSNRTTFNSRYHPLGNWIENGLNYTIGLNLSKGDIHRVCYRGIFMTTIRGILSAPVNNWNTVVQSLARGDNIEEGHYMERLWAPLLSPPLPRSKQDELRRETVSIKKAGSFTGVLVVNRTYSQDLV